MLNESVAACERARQIDPLVKSNGSVLNTYFYLGQYDKFLESPPDDNDSAFIVFYRGFGEYHRKNWAQAASNFERAYKLDPTLYTRIGMALSDAIAHKNSDGVQLLRQLEDKIRQRGVGDPEAAYKIAQAYAVLRDARSATRVFGYSIQNGFFCYPYFLIDPLLENIRHDPQFPQLMSVAQRRHEAFKRAFSDYPSSSPHAIDRLDRTMKPRLPRILSVLVLVAGSALTQEEIPLYPGTPPGSVEPSYPEKHYFSKAWNAEVVSNVTKPSLTLYRPVAGGSGNAAVVCPGGGFMALSIDNEGTEVAKWLAARGITAFVLKYRLAHTGDDATQEFLALFAEKAKLEEMLKKTVPLSIADGIAAVAYVRRHASDWGIFPDKVGIIGFSAGGTVTAAAGLHYSPESRPAFVAAIYPATSMLKDDAVPPDAPPMFLAAATDDQFKLVPDSISLYNEWTAAGKSAELHIYAKGGHGFGMRKQGYPSDQWVDRFAEWLDFQGFMKR